MATLRELEASAIDQQGMTGNAAARDILIHDAAAHADEVVFGALADLAASIGSNSMPLSMSSACATETSSAAEELKPAPIGTSLQTMRSAAGKVAPAPLQHQRDAENIVSPVAARGRMRRIEIELARLVHDHGVNAEASVGALRGGG